VQRTRFRHLRSALAAWTIALAVALGGRPARAQVVFQADGAVDLGYTATRLTPANSRRLYLDVRPALTVQFGSPRLTWRAGYLFAGSLTLDGTGSSAYSNQVSLALAAELSKRSTMTASGSITQGSTAFQLTQRAPDAGQADFRAPGNPDLVTATLAESFAWEASPNLRLGQGLLGSASAPQDALGRTSGAVTASASLDRLFVRDAVGALLRSGFAVLRPLAEGAAEARIVTNSLAGSWNHDFDPRWNAEVTAGVEQVIALTGSRATTIVPTGGLTARYLGDDSVVSLAVSQAAAANLQTGTESLNDEVVLRGAVSFDRIRQRQLGASAGFLRARPLGEVIPGAAATMGNAVQGDVGLVWGFSEVLLATARYSVAYQFGQGANLTPSLVHVALVGITIRYGNAPYLPPMPAIGRRVDGSDAVGFPAGGVREQ